MKRLMSLVAAAQLLTAGGVWAGSPPADPLHSVMWQQMAEQFLSASGGKVVFDDRVKVDTPKFAENQLAIPATVDARSLRGVKRIVVFADLNPVAHILTYQPIAAAPYISFRFKAEQGTPLRAAVLTNDGVWHVGGKYVDAAGGGCSQPATAHAKPDWVSHLAEVRAKIWRVPGFRSAKLRMRIFHPMDTGLADGIPAFFIERLDLKTPDGRVLGRLQLKEPVAENPTLTLRPYLPNSVGHVLLLGRDNEGNLIDVKIAAPWKSSSLSGRRQRAD